MNSRFKLSIFTFVRTDLQEGEMFALESTVDLPASTGGEQCLQVFIAHVEELVKVHPTVGELLEGSPLNRLLYFVSHD